MTTKYANMPAGREMDALVAEKVMGQDTSYLPISDIDGFPVPLKLYSTDIAAAWEVFDRMGPGCVVGQTDPGGWDDDYRWVVYDTTNSRPLEAHGPTAPLAICRAALAAVESNHGCTQEKNR